MHLCVAICDDMEEERLRLSKMLRNYAYRKNTGFHIELYSSGNHLVSALKPGRWDIVLLDIYMDGMDGMKAAEHLRREDKDCILIFVTMSREHGTESYKFMASDYLLKPVRQEHLDKSLNWCLNKYSERFRTISVRSEWDDIEIPIRDIHYIESALHTADIHTRQRVIKTPRGINALEKDIGSGDFLRCHRSYLINMNHVRRMDKQDFVMDNGDLVPIRTASPADIRQEFIYWVFQQGGRKANPFISL